MPRLRALSIALLAVVVELLAGCGPAAVAPTPAPATPSTTPATAAPTVAPAKPTPVVATAPPGLIGRLVFARFNEGIHRFTGMLVSPPDGSSEVEVPMPWTEGGGRWSTAGDLIAVPTQVADGRIGTAIIDAKGKVVRVLEIASKGLNLPCTKWSPDDKRLACEGWDESDPTRTGIYTVRSSDGGDMRRITTPPAGMSDEAGDWSADGKIVFKRYEGDEGPGPLYLVAAAGGEPALVTSSTMEDSGRFSPDGTLVASSAGGIIVVLDRTGARVSTIERTGRYLFGPAWSPDGEWLVFSNTPQGQFKAELFIARPGGADLYQVTRTSDNEIVVDWGATPG